MKHVISKAVALMLCCFMIIGFAACDPKAAPTKPDHPVETADPGELGTANPTDPAPAQIQEPTQEPTQEPEKQSEGFSMNVVNYLIENGYASKSFIMSPTSFRAALCLAIAGAKGDTQSQLLKAAGFDSIEEANTWYTGVLDRIAYFNEQNERDVESYESFGEKAPERAFQIANAVWNNSSVSCEFKESYLEYVKEHYDAEAHSSPKDTITADVNKWCEEKTNGMIKNAASDLSESASALINALYVKNSWYESFFEGATEKDIFRCVGGVEKEMDFMNQTNHYSYYADAETQIVAIPMFGDMDFICVIGRTEGISEKLKALDNAKVHIKIPKLDITSRFENSELVKYLSNAGVDLALDGARADFSEMSAGGSEEPWYIDDIMQVAKIKTDENGLEAAAVTIISVKAAGMPIEEEPIEEFIANVPFSFMITSGNYKTDDCEILFYGQMTGIE